ncbi:MAG: hypothetical protein IJO98_09290 [Clostridia bacterium]|nr:hypothetical protein [Clostridia bacterium]
MKKIAALALACILLCMSLTGCSDGSSVSSAPTQQPNFLPDATALPVDSGSAAEVLQTQPTAEPIFAIPAEEDTEEEPLFGLDTETTTEEPLFGLDTETATEEPLFGLDEETLPSVEDATAEPTEEPTPEPTMTPAPTVYSPYASYTYASLMDTSFGFVLNYPSTWRNLPGKYTVCFEEITGEGDFPARVAVTRKKLPHKPSSETLAKQFQAYVQQVCSQYDPKTFELSDLNSNTTFMKRDGYSIGYLAYSGDTEVQGYMCCCAIDYTVYVFHFCSTYEDFEPMKPVLTRIRDSVSLAAQ